jgi:L-asparaginase II
MALRVHPRDKASSAAASRYPDNPVLVQVWRGEQIESQHRGAWALVDASGRVLEGRGDHGASIFTRSSLKSVQALPLIESGAAQRFDFSDAEIALALASHNAEACHTQVVEAVLTRLGLDARSLQCGPQPPGDPEAELELRRAGRAPTAVHNNCSGKHAGFLALALHLGAPVESYLDPESPGQKLVRRAMLDLTGLAPEHLGMATDGCSAPTFRMPLTALATAFARVSSPEDLAPPRRAACQRMLTAVERYPHLIAGHHQRICTDIARVTRGRLFPKIGGEAVYGIGVRGAGRGLALKIDDGSTRGLHAVLVQLLRRLGFLTAEEAAALEVWEERRIRNWAGLEIGRTEVLA